MCYYTTLWNIRVQKMPCTQDLSLWSKQPLRTVVKIRYCHFSIIAPWMSMHMHYACWESLVGNSIVSRLQKKTLRCSDIKTDNTALLLWFLMLWANFSRYSQIILGKKVWLCWCCTGSAHIVLQTFWCRLEPVLGKLEQEWQQYQFGSDTSLGL